ncbi:glutamine-hydrolyzing carbamoyl-phosphate synthase small subunit [Geitlerinema splendidum]|nr:glutamine-hydrolyzing carbamoyl-phosphate synthase small subunit [Geitlerinema splendidum]
MKAYLVLSDGTVHEGSLIGAEGCTVGEVVFNTGMTGYQEILTDPSYAGQLVVFTYPMIGNYGINDDDYESDRIQVKGIIVREACDKPSNWRSRMTIDAHLRERGITGIQGLDTRAITKHIRSGGVMMGAISTSIAEAEASLESSRSYGEIEFVSSVSAQTPYCWGFSGKEEFDTPVEGYKGRIAVLDCGLKFNILRRFAALGIQSVVYPSHTEADELLSCDPNGILLSPGPGDPVRLQSVVSTVQNLIGRRPIFGICLGNQLLCQAAGAKTFKLKYGHRGSNHPVKDLFDGTVTITSQNHGYAVDPDSIPQSRAEVTQVNLNDGTVEGIRIKGEDATSIQYHPEAAPGPWDSRKYFVQFVEKILA